MKKHIAFYILGFCILALSACCTAVTPVPTYPSFSKVAYYPYDGAIYPSYTCATCLAAPGYSPVYIQTHGATYVHYNNVRYYP